MLEQKIYHGRTAELLEAFDYLFNRMPEAVSLLEYRSGTGTYRYLQNNTVHKELTGHKDIQGMKLEQVVDGKTCQSMIDYLAQCIESGKTVNFEQEYEAETGTQHWQTEMVPVTDGKEIRYVLLLSRDVSELKRIRHENEIFTQRMQAMFEDHSAFKMTIDTVNGEIIRVNSSLCDYLGYSKAEMLGRRVQEFNLLPPEQQADKMRVEFMSRILYAAAPHRLKNGEIRFFDVYPSAVFEEGHRLLCTVLFDVTDRERYREELQQEKEWLKTTLQSIGEGVVTTDNHGRITGLNAMAQELTGWDQDLVIGRPFTDVFILRSEDDGLPAADSIQAVLATGCIVRFAKNTELVNRQGNYFSIAGSIAPIKTADGKIMGIVMTFRDISAEKEYSRHIEFLSSHDALTGLHNRHYLEEAIAQFDLPENLPIAVLMGDINGLKIINDAFGYKNGDALLKNVAALLRENCEPDHLIARWGGDEFVIFMPRTDLEKAEKIVRNIMDAPIPCHVSNLQYSLSLGCSVKNSLDSSISDILQEAEESMLRHKLLNGKSYRNAIINTLLAALYENSNETAEHSKRLEEYCHLIGRALGISSIEMSELSLLALLHDIGKVGIDPHILKKPAALTAEEWEEMKRHPEIGYRIVQATPELAMIADFVLSHHERWDGKGYPYGFKGEDIPLLSRILTVADAFDAMMNDRVYRQRMSQEEALQEIESNSGTQFDPAIARIFLDNIIKQG